ncbi:MAG TPA: SDR family oxidoreductase [Myxococcota bacterium]|nr:SDR family oxidoreductase [Myxococcota bacterium]HRY95948.1 SDR family oxidoreductase [Myxococcota bacterium]
MDLGLTGKRALVGGASRGLGLAVARALVSEGAEVLLSARGRPALEAAAAELGRLPGARVHLHPADLARPEDREALFAAAERALGQVDILVANAGGPPPGPFEAHPAEHWQLALELSLGQLTHLCRLALPGMRRRGFGRVVQIVSIAGLEAMDGLILSNASRPAVLGCAKALAREVAPHGVLVNSICPGIFLTDRIRELGRERARAEGVTEEAWLRAFCADIPLGRPGRPEEVGDLAAFLCSPRNSYVTGATLVIDGGKTRRLG